MLGGRVLDEAIQDAGPVEPGRDGEPAGYGGGLEPADLLHPPDVELQVRPLRCQRVQAVLGAPGQVAAQVGFGVLAGGAFEAGQVGRYRQSQPVGERPHSGGSLGAWASSVKVIMPVTLQQLAITVKLPNTHLAAT